MCKKFQSRYSDRATRHRNYLARLLLACRDFGLPLLLLLRSRLSATASRMRFFSARSLILSPSNKSIARHVPPPRPALKSLSGSGRLAPWEKVSFTLSLWALPTAIIPSRDHTGLPIHFHSSTISGSAW